jgi:hypothetical protein
VRLEGNRTKGKTGARGLAGAFGPGLVLPLFKPRFAVRSIS